MKKRISLLHLDTICPFKTRTYRDGGDAAEGGYRKPLLDSIEMIVLKVIVNSKGGVPMCTLRNFPHLTEHCIEWARVNIKI